MPYKNPHPLYYVWAKIRYRARISGTRVHPEWHNFSQFLSDVGERPEEGMILTLKNDSIGYTKENCVWVHEKDKKKIKVGYAPSVSHELYTVWRSMIGRCQDTNSQHFYNYGGRGIKVCKRWLDSFHAFVADMGDRPQGTSIDRINNDGNYEPSNCRWATKKEQQANRRVNRLISFNGETKPLRHWADTLGVKSDTIAERIERGYPLSVALTVKRLPMNLVGLKLGGQANGRAKMLVTHCKHGHLFDDKNTLTTKEGWRRCRKCHALRASNKRKTPT